MFLDAGHLAEGTRMAVGKEGRIVAETGGAARRPDQCSVGPRLALLESEGMLFTEALLEPLLPYPSKISLATALERSATTPSIATTARRRGHSTDFRGRGSAVQG